MSANLAANDVLEKNLTVFGVSNSFGNSDAVINMLVHGAVDISHFEKEVLTEYNPAALLAERCENPTGKRNKLTVLKMII